MAHVDFQINLRQRAFAFAKKRVPGLVARMSKALETAPCVRFFYVRAQWEGFGPAGSLGRSTNLLLPGHPFGRGPGFFRT